MVLKSVILWPIASPMRPLSSLSVGVQNVATSNTSQSVLTMGYVCYLFYKNLIITRSKHERFALRGYWDDLDNYIRRSLVKVTTEKFS